MLSGRTDAAFIGVELICINIIIIKVIPRMIAAVRHGFLARLDKSITTSLVSSFFFFLGMKELNVKSSFKSFENIYIPDKSYDYIDEEDSVFNVNTINFHDASGRDS